MECEPGIRDLLRLGFSTLALEVHFPAEFSSNPNQTPEHLTKVFRIDEKLKAGEFDQG